MTLYGCELLLLSISSISVRTVDSPESPQTGTVGVSLVDTQPVPASESSTFEEIIDLATVPSKPLKGSGPLGDSLLNHSEEHLNLNNLDNGHMSEAGDASSEVPVTKPVIAFEENATRQDVPGKSMNTIVKVILALA